MSRRLAPLLLLAAQGALGYMPAGSRFLPAKAGCALSPASPSASVEMMVRRRGVRECSIVGQGGGRSGWAASGSLLGCGGCGVLSFSMRRSPRLRAIARA
jgi:hypothetical protein